MRDDTAVGLRQQDMTGNVSHDTVVVRRYKTRLTISSVTKYCLWAAVMDCHFNLCVIQYCNGSTSDWQRFSFNLTNINEYFLSKKPLVSHMGKQLQQS